MADPRIALRPDHRDREQLDDVYVCDVAMFRAESMADDAMWMACYFNGTEQRLMLRVRAELNDKGKPVLWWYASETPAGAEFTYEEQA